MLPKFCNKSGASRLSLGTFSVVRSQRKMKYVAADRQNSSGPGPTKAVLNSPNHTSLSFHHFDPLNSNLNYKESLSADARQAIISHPFVGQSGDLSYGVNHNTSAQLYENNEPDAQIYESIPTSEPCLPNPESTDPYLLDVKSSLDQNFSESFLASAENQTFTTQTITSPQASVYIENPFQNINIDHQLTSIIGPQTSHPYYWPTSTMNYHNTPEVAEAGPSFPTNEETSLKCIGFGCDDKSFPTKSALKKHQDKHNRPYMCNQPSCKGQTYADKGGLQRHERERHGSEYYTCPVLTCKRNKKGFARQNNLIVHQVTYNHLPPSNLSVTNPPNRSSGIRRRFPELQHEDSFEELMDRRDDAQEDTNTGTVRDVKRSLQDLRAKPARIDSQIILLETSLDQMNDYSS